jgi:hypothetical protein
MKKNIILSIVFLIFIFLFGILYGSNRRAEGMVTGNNTTTTIDKITLTTQLDATNILVEKDKTLKTSAFCAIIDANQLKILKNPDDDSTTWDEIWVSNRSNKLFSGDKLTLSSTNLGIGINKIVTGFVGATSLELVDGDLLIKKDSSVLWSLLDQEINTAKSDVKTYMSSSETVRATLNANGELKDKLTNLNAYVMGIEDTLKIDEASYKKMVGIRHQMDFELSEINGANGTKINVSQTELQSTMYLNLAIAVLVTSVVVLLYSR